jgi:hypothetical protein
MFCFLAHTLKIWQKMLRLPNDNKYCNAENEPIIVCADSLILQAVQLNPPKNREHFEYGHKLINCSM